MARGHLIVVDVGIAILVEDGGANGGDKSAERSEGVVYRTGFITTVHHAIGALGIATLAAVILPLGLTQKFGVGISVAVLHQVTRFLPAEDVIGGYAPGRAVVIA